MSEEEIRCIKDGQKHASGGWMVKYAKKI